MHNIHFMRVAADSAQEAYDTVKYTLEDWGDEDNWFTIPIVLEKSTNKVTIFNARWDHLNTKTKILRFIDKLDFTNPYTLNNEAKDSYSLRENMLYWRHELYTYKGKPTLWEKEVFSWKFSDVGFTNLNEEKDCNYLVIIDMHS